MRVYNVFYTRDVLNIMNKRKVNNILSRRIYKSSDENGSIIYSKFVSFSFAKYTPRIRCGYDSIIFVCVYTSRLLGKY